MLNLFLIKCMQYILLTIMAINDARTHKILLIHLVLFMFSAVFFIKWENFLLIIIFGIGFFLVEYYGKTIANRIKKRITDRIAIADILLILTCILMLDFEYIGIFLTLLGFSSSIFGIYSVLNSKTNEAWENKFYLTFFQKMKNLQIPLVPFILLSYWITSILLYIG